MPANARANFVDASAASLCVFATPDRNLHSIVSMRRLSAGSIRSAIVRLLIDLASSSHAVPTDAINVSYSACVNSGSGSSRK